MSVVEQSPVEPAAAGCPFAATELFTLDPFPAMAVLQQDTPARLLDFPDGIPQWVVTRHADVVAALNDPRFSSELGRGLAELAERGVLAARSYQQQDELLGRTMLKVDGAEHTRLRKLAVRAFTARRMEALRPRIAEITEELLDGLAGRDEVDLVAEFAIPLPVRVICELLGVPVQDQEQFRTASGQLLSIMDSPEAAEVVVAAIAQLSKYLSALIAAKRLDPGDDLLSDLVAINEEEGDRCSDEELLGTALLLLVAGHETTANLIGNGVLALLTHPEQLELLKADLSLMPSAVEELLRFAGPLHPGLTRYTLEDVELAGVLIPRGSYVLLLFGAANRDPAKFTNPQELDLTRDEPGHLAFGHGAHYCLGARLAKIEAEIALSALLSRYGGLRLAGPAAALRPRPNLLRGLVSLPLRLAA